MSEPKQYHELVGKICWTSFDPRGKVRVTLIEYGNPITAFGYWMHDFRGYKKGSPARYHASELTICEDQSE